MPSLSSAHCRHCTWWIHQSVGFHMRGDWGRVACFYIGDHSGYGLSHSRCLSLFPEWSLYMNCIMMNVGRRIVQTDENTPDAYYKDLDIHYKNIPRLTWLRHQMEAFSALLAICVGIHRSPVNSPHKGQWRGALVFSLICVWIDGWVNNPETVDLRRHRANYDVTAMNFVFTRCWFKTIWVNHVLDNNINSK